MSAEAHMPPPPQLTFELLFEEIRRACRLTPDQVRQLEHVASIWANQRLWLPSRQHWLRQRAHVVACRLLLSGEVAPLVRDRLMVMGCSRRLAYRTLDRARRSIREQQLG
jgi:hypothetical protein